MYCRECTNTATIFCHQNKPRAYICFSQDTVKKALEYISNHIKNIIPYHNYGKVLIYNRGQPVIQTTVSELLEYNILV